MLVHDAARPLVDDAVVERLLAPLGEGFDGAVPALPVPDTLKRVRDGVDRRDRRPRRPRRRADAAGVPRADAPACVRRRSPSDGLRLARRAHRRASRRRRGRSEAAEGDDAGGSGARRVVALEAVVFDVGETLVDEERWWRRLADHEGLQPHVVWAALGVTIARGEEHDALWGHLGIDKPPALVARDLRTGSTICIRTRSTACAAFGSSASASASSETRPRRSRRGRASRRSPPTSSPRRPASASASPIPRSSSGRRADRLRAARGRIRRRPCRQRRSAGCGRRTRCRARSARSLGSIAADASGGGARDRRPCVAAERVSLARVTELRVGIGYDAHALEEGVPLVLGGVTIEYPRGSRVTPTATSSRTRSSTRFSERRTWATSVRSFRRETSSIAARRRSTSSGRPIARCAKRVGSSSTPTACSSGRSRASATCATRCASASRAL